MNANLYLSLVRWLRIISLVLRLVKLIIELIGSAINYQATNYVKFHAKMDS
ncbi:MAG: hypothetical protein RIQ84_1290 [Pseudomonadota bacterium]